MNTIPSIQPYTVEPAGNYPATDYQYVDPAVNTPAPQSKQRTPLIFLALAAAFIGIVGLAFILLSSNNTSNQNNNGDNQVQNVVLQWWGVFLSSEVVQPLLDEYKTIKPNVTIEYANKWPTGDFNSASKSYRDELNRVLNTSDPVQLPDIFMVHNTWAGDYEAYTRSSTTYDANNFSASFHPAVTTDFANAGVVFGVPLWMDTLGIIYNRDLLNSVQLTEPPNRWPRFKTAAQALTIKDGNRIDQSGFSAGLTENVSFFFELVNLFLIQNGVQIADSANNPTFSADSDSVDAINFFKSFTTDSNNTWNRDQKNESASFLEENTAMIAAPSWRLRDVLRLNEQLELGIDIGVAGMPQIEGQNQPILNWADYWGNMVTLNRPYSNEAWEFLYWITQPEQLQKLSDNVREANGYFGILYPRTDMNDLLVDDPYLSSYNESLPFAQSWYMVKGWDVKQAFKEVLEQPSVNASNLASLENKIRELQVLKGILE